jgi:aryl-phospho-beta-D-glucosidase BglC (GH1 family)
MVEPPYELDQEKLDYLDNAIAWSEEVGLYVILHFRNGPGKSEDTFASGEGKTDETVWYSEKEQAKWVEMWAFVARRYKNRPNIIAYNLMVEPHPEDPAKQEPADADVWTGLAKRITDAIRSVDKETPIIISSTWWSNPIGFQNLKPTGDLRTIYAFHMYEPTDFTHQSFEWAGKGNVSALVYPGMIYSDVYEETRYWDKNLLQEFLDPVLSFQKKYNTPIFIGEFGCNRKVSSCVTYLDDLLSIFEDRGWSYTYFLWRDIDEFDYEKEATGNTRVTESAYMKLFKKYWSENEYFTTIN